MWGYVWTEQIVLGAVECASGDAVRRTRTRERAKGAVGLDERT